MEPPRAVPTLCLDLGDVGAAIDAKRFADSAAEWLQGQREPQSPHQLEEELAEIQDAVGASEEFAWHCGADKLLWRGLRWF
jgi:hypothetical protein